MCWCPSCRGRAPHDLVRFHDVGYVADVFADAETGVHRGPDLSTDCLFSFGGTLAGVFGASLRLLLRVEAGLAFLAAFFPALATHGQRPPAVIGHHVVDGPCRMILLACIASPISYAPTRRGTDD